MMKRLFILSGVLLLATSNAHAQIGMPELVYGEEISARFMRNGALDKAGIPYHMYWFAGAAGQRVTIRVNTPSFEPAISLFRASNGVHVATRHGTEDARLFANLNADDLYIVTVTSLHRIDAGSYKLSIGADPPLEGNVLLWWDFAASRPFKPGQTQNCSLRYDSAALVIAARSKGSACAYWTSAAFRAPVRLQAEMRAVTQSAGAKLGLAFDRKPDGREVLFLIAPETNTFEVYQKSETGWVTLVAKTWTPAIKSSGWNVLSAEIQQGSVRLFINRMPVRDVKLTSPVDGAAVLWNNGAASSSESNIVEFRELLVERLE